MFETSTHHLLLVLQLHTRRLRPSPVGCLSNLGRTFGFTCVRQCHGWMLSKQAERRRPRSSRRCGGVTMKRNSSVRRIVDACPPVPNAFGGRGETLRGRPSLCCPTRSLHSDATVSVRRPVPVEGIVPEEALARVSDCTRARAAKATPTNMTLKRNRRYDDEPCLPQHAAAAAAAYSFSCTWRANPKS